MALIWMPFSTIHCPSIGLTLLRRQLEQRRVPARLLYYTFTLAALAGVEAYRRVTDSRLYYTYLTGEWIFADALFEHLGQQDGSYASTLVGEAASSLFGVTEAESRQLLDAAFAVKARVADFLDQCVEDVVHRGPRVVGFSSIFQQQLSSLALARRIKERLPDTFVVFGGTNCQDVKGREMIRQFPFIDAVVSGEGDVVFPDLVERVLKDKPLSGLHGVYTPGEHTDCPDGCACASAAPVGDLDALPFVDYDDFFEQMTASGIHLAERPMVFCETSRGCWWGKCTFCSLHCDYKGYRRKSSGRALAELTQLFDKYPQHHVQMVDNVVPNEYFSDLLPALAKLRSGGAMFYAVKSNLRKEQVSALRDAGVWYLQVGVESLSTCVLRIMRKGVTALQNIQLLKWCREMGLDACWYLLQGFPDEPPQEYARMAELVPWLVHLQPPDSILPLYLTRSSPNFEHADELGFADIAPAPAYRFVYPLAPEIVRNLAYFFSYGHQRPQDVTVYTEPLRTAVAAWKEGHDSSVLCCLPDDEDLLIWDDRPAAATPLIVLSGIERALYEACDAIQHISRLQRIAAAHTGTEWSEADVRTCLRRVLDRHLMIEEDSRYLSLAVARSTYYPRASIVTQIRAHAGVHRQIAEHERISRAARLIPLPEDMRVESEELARAMSTRRSGV